VCWSLGNRTTQRHVTLATSAKVHVPPTLQCKRRRCRSVATRFPVLIFPDIATVEVGMPLCDTHALSCRLLDLYDDDMHVHYSAEIAKTGKTPPPISEVKLKTRALRHYTGGISLVA
jgi:hypothetical protein